MYTYVWKTWTRLHRQCHLTGFGHVRIMQQICLPLLFMVTIMQRVIDDDKNLSTKRSSACAARRPFTTKSALWGAEGAMSTHHMG